MQNKNTFLSLLFVILFILGYGCDKDVVTEPPKDTEKPTVSILFPLSGSDVKADTVYTVKAIANDNIEVTKVEFYVSGQYAATDSLSPYEYLWSTHGLTGNPTIMAKAFDEAGNFGFSETITVNIKVTSNYPPIQPSSPLPVNGATGISICPILSWSCSDPDSDSITYDVFFDTSVTPTTQIATGQSTTIFACIGLSNSTTYYWKVNAKDSKGAITSGAVWSFTTGIGVIAQDLVQVLGGQLMWVSTPTTISSFKIDKYEVTYDKWTDIRNWALTHGYTDLVVGQNGFHPSGTNNPVTTVDWYDIVKWCNARSEKDCLMPVYYTDNTQSTVYRTGEININLDAVKWDANGYRLPTEAEWEFAASGGNSTHYYTYSGSNTIEDVAWYSGNSGGTTHTVGTKSANELGIYDMSGNAWEFCWDWYGSTYPSGGTSDPKGPSTTQSDRVVRGGSFAFIPNVGPAGYYCYVTFRSYGYCGPNVRHYLRGFRCAQD